MNPVDFRRSKWWIQRQAQVCASSLQVRRNCERASDYGVVTQCRGSPRETDARLEVFASPGSVVEGPAGAVLTSEIDIAGGKVLVCLLVVGLNPRSMRIVAQSEI